jgi:hypothetical protein
LSCCRLPFHVGLLVPKLQQPTSSLHWFSCFQATTILLFVVVLFLVLLLSILLVVVILLLVLLLHILLFVVILLVVLLSCSSS